MMSEKKSFHPAMSAKRVQKYLDNHKKKHRINSVVLVAYVKKHNINALEFCNFVGVVYDVYKRLIFSDSTYVTAIHTSTIRKIVDCFYNNIDDQFKIDVKKLLPDHWHYFVPLKEINKDEDEV